MDSVPFRHRLTVRLTGGVILVLLAIGCPFLLLFHGLLKEQQLDSLREATTALSQVLSDGLRSTMLAGQPHLLDEAVRNLSRRAEVERVLLLDHRGSVRVSSDPAYEGRTLNRERDETCRVCHRGGDRPAASQTAVNQQGGRRVFRAMTAIPNEPPCQGCHDASQRTNGILLVDLALAGADRRFFADIQGTVALGAVMVLLTIAVLVLLLRRMVHRPLQAVVAASRRIVKGEVEARVEVSSPGEFGLLASQVNRMTDHLAKSLQTVEAQHRELQAILDAVDDEIVVLDREQRVVAANHAFRKAVGRSEEEIAGRLCREVSALHWPCALDHPDGCPAERVFRTSRHHKGILARTGADGRERSIEIHASPLRGTDGQIHQTVEVRRDISERRQMEANLAQSERLASLGLLASGLSHEINNPLGAIAASVEGLLRRLPTEPGLSPEAIQILERSLRRIGQEVERGRQITHRLLKVARPPDRKRSLVSVNDVVKDIVAILAHPIKTAGVLTHLELTHGLPPLRGDDSSLGQVIMNLTMNAIQAMPEGKGTLWIKTGAENGTIRIEVVDSGCGIPAALLNRVYEPFFTTKPVGQGTGLGLFITHRIVTEMGGTIQVSSEPGKGTRVIVRVPQTEDRIRS